MIQEPLAESHVKSMFIHNIHLELKFIALDYMSLQFTNIVHRLVKKEKYLIDMEKLKYGNIYKEIKRGIIKNSS